MAAKAEMEAEPIRLAPGADLRGALEASAAGRSPAGGFVVAGFGSLVDARLRFAGSTSETLIQGPIEIISLTGTLTPQGAHLHACVADAAGSVYGGHLGYGCEVRTTAELLLTWLPDWNLTRAPDPQTGFKELVVRRKT